MEERRGRRELRAGKAMGAELNCEPGEGGGAKQEKDDPDHEPASKRIKTT